MIFFVKHGSWLDLAHPSKAHFTFTSFLNMRSEVTIEDMCQLFDHIGFTLVFFTLLGFASDSPNSCLILRFHQFFFDMTQDLEMRDRSTPSNSVSLPAPSTLQRKHIASFSNHSHCRFRNFTKPFQHFALYFFLLWDLDSQI